MKDPKRADTEVKINTVNIIHLITANLYVAPSYVLNALQGICAFPLMTTLSRIVLSSYFA